MTITLQEQAENETMDDIILDINSRIKSNIKNTKTILSSHVDSKEIDDMFSYEEEEESTFPDETVNDTDEAL